MKNLIKKLNTSHFLLFTLFISVLALAPLTVFAQESSATVTITPAQFNEDVEPGDFYSGELRVTNETDSPQAFFFFARDVSGTTGDGSTPVFDEENFEDTGLELSSWLEFEEGPYNFEPGETKTISFEVFIPENAPPGSHVGGLFLSREADNPEAIGSGVGYQVGSIMNFRVDGEILEEARIREFSTEEFLHSEPSVNFNISVENLGNTLIRPNGIIEISNTFGGNVENIDVNESGRGVFMGSDRDFNVTWEGDRLSFGRYQAVLSMVYGQDERKTIRSTTSFWVLPVTAIAITLGGFAVFILVLSLLVQLYIRKKIKAMGGAEKADLPEDAAYPGRPVSKFAILAIATLMAVVAFILILFLMLA